MLQINSFYPMSNFTRATHDFYDDKIAIKVKSFTTEYENEVKYEEIRHIQLVKTADLRWLWFGILVTMLPSLISFMSFVFSLDFLKNPPFPFIGKIIILIGVILCIPAFHKNEVYFFADQANRDIVSIKIDNKNRMSMHQAVELVRQKSPIISDTNPNLAFPNLPPAFEYEQFEFTNYLNKRVAKFFEDKFIYKENSLVEDIVIEVNYSELSGKILRLKTTDDGWSSIIFALFILTMSLCLSSNYIFPQLWYGLSLKLFLKIVVSFMLLIFFTSYIKKEVYLFYNKNDKIVYSAKPNPKNPKELENIIEYVKNKIHDDENQVKEKQRNI